MKKEQLEINRHSLSHILASAVLEMFPEAKFGIGPAIENGFYYDFDLPRTLIPEDLPILEEKMKNIIKQNLPFEKTIVKHNKAIELFEKAKQKYKIEILLDKTDKEEVSLYRIGNFVDLCKGPHVDSTGEINKNSFKLKSVAGAYWKGNEKNKMLQRIYGIAFENKDELNKYLKMEKEAKERDHRKLGKELDLFTFSDLVGAGLPLFTPKGTLLRTELYKALIDISKKYDVQMVTIPHIAKIDLYKTSGHIEKFSDELFKVISKYGESFVLKPVNCPHHTQIYSSKLRSYKELPIRYMESTMMYRDEKPGEISGLSRVRSITCDDGHTFCAVDQIKQEAKNICKIVEEFYRGIGMFEKHWVSLSVRDYNSPEKYIGDPKDWDKAEKMLREISDELNLDAKKTEGEAAIYGPKLDYMFKDSLGNERQLATIQIDFAMPKRFNLFYINKNGEKETPVMLHRAILGSFERFMAFLIEHFSGAFPVWLAPVQVKILPVSIEKHIDYAQKVYLNLSKENIRVEIDDENDSISKRILFSEKQKIPYILVVGDKEIRDNIVSIRSRNSKKIDVMNIEIFKEKIRNEIKMKS